MSIIDNLFFILKQKGIVTYPSYMNEGFSREDALNLEYIHNNQLTKPTYGIFFGIASVYLLKNFYKKLETSYPNYFYSRTSYYLLRLSTVYFSYKFFDYCFNSRRQSGNSNFSSLYSNNVLIKNKEKIHENFKTFNRKFTEEEIEKFLHNKNLKKLGRKKYIYNPAVHGDNEEEFKIKFEKFNSGLYPIKEDLKNSFEKLSEIYNKNTEDFDHRPFIIKNNIDRTGLTLGIKNIYNKQNNLYLN